MDRTTAGIRINLKVKGGSGTFLSTANTALQITHGFGIVDSANYVVSITPTSVTNLFLGEFYVVKNNDGTFDVYKTGSGVGITFDWIAFLIT